MGCFKKLVKTRNSNEFRHFKMPKNQDRLLSMDNLECPSMEDQPQSLPSMEAQPKKVKKPLKLLSISNTRWLVVADCAQRILTQYDALTAMFDKTAYQNPMKQDF